MRVVATALLSLLVVAGCGGSRYQPRLEGAATFKILEELMALGPRCSGCWGMLRQQERVVEVLEQAGAEVVQQSFELQVIDEETVETLVNIMGRFDAGNPDRVVLVTHYDTRREAELDPDPEKRHLPIPGANDGGSGTAILLALAPLLREQPPPVGVDLIFFDGEEWGKPEPGKRHYCQGSRYLCRRFSSFYAQPPRWVICIDMVGDRHLAILREPGSVAQAPALVERIWQVAREQGATGFKDDTLQMRIDDDHTAFQQHGVPGALLIDYDYVSEDGSVNYYHTHQDTLDKVSPDSLEQVGRVVEAMVYDPVVGRAR